MAGGSPSWGACVPEPVTPAGDALRVALTGRHVWLVADDGARTPLAALENPTPPADAPRFLGGDGDAFVAGVVGEAVRGFVSALVTGLLSGLF